MTTSKTRQRWTLINITAIVLGFVIWWPLGLGILAYVLWGGQVDKEIEAQARKFQHRPSGNAAFDEYKTTTLSRLEEEQEAFGTFLEKLRATKDKDEFDRFMSERGERQTA